MSDEDRIARVALALCVADGQEPEADITIGSEVVDEEDGGERYHEVTGASLVMLHGRSVAAGGQGGL